MSQEKVVISVRDRQLVLQRAQKGDSEALNSLFESCRGRLLACALGMLHRREDAEDAVRDAMLAAFTHLKGFQGRADFLTWATRIVINTALIQIRKARSRPVIPWYQANDEIEQSSLGILIEDRKPTPEQMYQQAEQKRLLEEIILQLPAEHRRAIQFWKLTDCSMKDASTALGISVSTLKARLHRGRRSLLLKFNRKTPNRRATSQIKKELSSRMARDQSHRAA